MKPSFAYVAAIGLLAAAFAIAGCGRKGPLDPPPSEGSTAPAKKPASSGASLSAIEPSEAPSSPPAFDAQGRPVAPANAPKKRLPMDWLIE